jgi:hypothetical protein
VNRETVPELTALADGSLPPERHVPLLLTALASPELTRQLEQQLRAILAVRGLTTPAPASLRSRIEAERRRAVA